MLCDVKSTGRRGFVAATLLVCTACGSAAVGLPQRPRTDVPAVPEILSLTADPVSIVEGESAELSWEVNDSNASLKLSPLGLTVVGTSIDVAPVVSTTYTLTATNSVGITFKSVTVSVVPPTADRPGTGSALTAGAWSDVTGNLVGLPSECGTVSSVSADPTSDRVIAGVAAQGLWSLGADGIWSRLGQGAGSDPVVNRANSITWDPTNPSRFWESGAYGGVGAYRTDNDGQTFTRLGDLSHPEFISIDFTDPDRQTILAGAHESGRLFRSTNGGDSWTDVSGPLPDGIGYAESPLIIDAQTYLLGTWRDTQSGVYRTTDRGGSWERVADIGVVGRPAVVEGAIYWLLENQQGMIRSDDGGLSWQPTGSGPSSVESKTVIALPDGRIAAIGKGSILTTSDQGDTWNRLGPPLPFDPHGFTYSPSLNALFAWHFDCGDDGIPVNEESIIRFDLDRPEAVDTTSTTIVAGATTTSTTTG